PGRQYWLPNGRRVPARPDRLYPAQMPGASGQARGRHHSPAPAPPAEDPLGTWGRAPSAAGTPPRGSPGNPAAGTSSLGISTSGSPATAGGQAGPQRYGSTLG